MGSSCSRRNAHQEPAALGGGVRIQNSPQQSAKARANWKLGFRRVHRILVQRRLWAELGHFLQADPIQDLVLGLERRGGQLVRVRAADQEIARREASAVAKAKARVRSRFGLPPRQ